MSKRLSLEEQKRKANAVKYLRSILPPGSTVYCNLKNVSRSGMSREIRHTSGSYAVKSEWI